MKFNNSFSNTSSFRTSIILGSLYQMMINYENLNFFGKIYYNDLETTMKNIVNVGTLGYPDVYYFIQDFLKKEKLSNWEMYNANSCTIKKLSNWENFL